MTFYFRGTCSNCGGKHTANYDGAKIRCCMELVTCDYPVNMNGEHDEYCWVYRLGYRGVKLYTLGAIRTKQHSALFPMNKTLRINDIMPFGKHKGKPIYTIPSGYVQWFSENVNGWTIDFESYLDFARKVNTLPKNIREIDIESLALH